jgi:hypothetical protein
MVYDIAFEDDHLPEAQQALSRCIDALSGSLPPDAWEFRGDGKHIVVKEDRAIVDYWMFNVRITFAGDVWIVVGGALPPTLVRRDRRDSENDVIAAAIESRSGYFTEMFGALWYSDLDRPFLWDYDWSGESGSMLLWE